MSAFFAYFFGQGSEVEFSIFTPAHFAPIVLMLTVIYVLAFALRTAIIVLVITLMYGLACLPWYLKDKTARKAAVSSACLSTRPWAQPTRKRKKNFSLTSPVAGRSPAGPIVADEDVVEVVVVVVDVVGMLSQCTRTAFASITIAYIYPAFYPLSAAAFLRFSFSPVLTLPLPTGVGGVAAQL